MLYSSFIGGRRVCLGVVFGERRRVYQFKTPEQNDQLQREPERETPEKRCNRLLQEYDENRDIGAEYQDMNVNDLAKDRGVFDHFYQEAIKKNESLKAKLTSTEEACQAEKESQEMQEGAQTTSDVEISEDDFGEKPEAVAANIVPDESPSAIAGGESDLAGGKAGTTRGKSPELIGSTLTADAPQESGEREGQSAKDVNENNSQPPAAAALNGGPGMPKREAGEMEAGFPNDVAGDINQQGGPNKPEQKTLDMAKKDPPEAHIALKTGGDGGQFDTGVNEVENPHPEASDAKTQANGGGIPETTTNDEPGKPPVFAKVGNGAPPVETVPASEGGGEKEAKIVQSTAGKENIKVDPGKGQQSNQTQTEKITFHDDETNNKNLFGGVMHDAGGPKHTRTIEVTDDKRVV